MAKFGKIGHTYFIMEKYLKLRHIICQGLIFAFLLNSFGPLPTARADEFRLPAPGVRVALSPAFNPPILKGIKVHPDNPFRFDFILDKGESQLSNNALKSESSKLIKYFLASLTIPEKDLWVNLSPYEKNRIVPESFGQTEMGRDLLAEDYMLKQITASLIYPEDEIGKKFWKRIYEEAAKKFGTTNIPVNTFNKVWIVPEKAVVYENAKAGTAYVVTSKLKVMLEQDYLALEKNTVIPAPAALLRKAKLQGGIQDTSTLGSQIVREIVIPELTKEVNEDKNFSQLRQVYNSLILATWYKKKIKDSILKQVYADKNKVAGIVSLRGSATTEAIYQKYLQAFKKGVYNYIKEEPDPMTQETIPRKYFSGGTDLAMNTNMLIFVVNSHFLPPVSSISNDVLIQTDLAMASKNYEPGNAAMLKLAKVLNLPQNSKEVQQVLKWFSDNWQEAVSLIGPDIIHQERWPLIDRLVNEGLELGIIADLVNYHFFFIQSLSFEDFPSEFQSFIINNAKFRRVSRVDFDRLFIWFFKYKLKMHWELLNPSLFEFMQIFMAIPSAVSHAEDMNSSLRDNATERQIIEAFIRKRGLAVHGYYQFQFITQRNDAIRKTSQKLNLSTLPYPLPNIWEIRLTDVYKDGTRQFNLVLKDKKILDELPGIRRRLINGGLFAATVNYAVNDSVVRIKMLQVFLLPDERHKRLREQLGPLDKLILETFEKYIQQQHIGHTILAPTGSTLFKSTELALHRNSIARFNNLFSSAGYTLDKIAVWKKGLGSFHEGGIKNQVTGGDGAMVTNKQHHNAAREGGDTDGAMIEGAEKNGGIDLTSDKALSVQNNGQGIKFHLDPAQFAQLQNAPGFVPVIINIQPLKSLPEFLGLNQPSQ